MKQVGVQLDNIKSNWETCVKCKIGENANNHVFYDFIPRPAKKVDIVFIGESPGLNEDTQGIPFIGVAGSILRRAIKDAGRDDLTIALVNLLACRAHTIGHGNRPPTNVEITNCMPRLVETIKCLDPIMLIATGKIPETYLFMIDLDVIKESIHHPAYIVRKGGMKSFMYPDYIQTIKSLFERVKNENKNRETELNSSAK